MRKINRNIFWLLLYGAWLALIVVALYSCGAGSIEATPEQQARVDELIQSRKLVFDATFAMPLASQAYMNAANLGGIPQARGNSVSQISLSGDGYFIALDADSAEVHLPYFGMRDNVTDYSGQAGIQIKGPLQDFTVSSTNNKHIVEFFVQESFERFRVSMSISPNLQTQVTIFSPQRDVIRYLGYIRPSTPE